MFVLEKIAEFIDFMKEARVLHRIDGKTEYDVYSINGEIAEQNIFIDGESVKTSLKAKERYIEAYAEKERLFREKAVAKAEKKGKPLSAEAVKILRDEEDKKRFEAYRHIWDLRGR